MHFKEPRSHQFLLAVNLFVGCTSKLRVDEVYLAPNDY